MRPSDERDLVRRLADVLRDAPADAESLEVWIRDAARETDLGPDYVQALRAVAIPAEPSRWVALATVAVSVRSGRLPVVDGDRVISWEEFQEYVAGLAQLREHAPPTRQPVQVRRPSEGSGRGKHQTRRQQPRPTLLSHAQTVLTRRNSGGK
jgi:hypothetical protein